MSSLQLAVAQQCNNLAAKHFPEGLTQEIIRLMDDVRELLSTAYRAGMEAGEMAVPQPWSNQSAFGYAILAAERIGMSEEQIQRLVRAMHNRFDMMTLGEAADHYCKSPY